MSTENVSLKKIDLGDYVFLARPCVAVSEEAVKHLAERAVQGKLEFIGVFDDRMDDSVQREVVMSLASSPEISIAIRHVCAGLYSRSFLDTYCDGVETHQQGLFPDLYILWMAFVHADRAMFAACDMCDRVEIDTVWIDDGVHGQYNLRPHKGSSHAGLVCVGEVEGILHSSEMEMLLRDASLDDRGCGLAVC